MGVGLVLSLVLGCFARRALVVFLGSVALAAPGVAYGTLHPAGLELGGIIHAFGFALPALFLHAIIESVRRGITQRQSSDSHRLQ
jgi:hypothetical protein